MNIHQYMTSDHKACDDKFAEAEELASKKDYEKAKLEFAEFQKMLLRHFELEEGILFPAIEKATGMTAGPTEVMRHEHSQIKTTVNSAAAMLNTEDGSQFAGAAETLNILIQQHNMKEEQVLYQMADRLFQDEATALVARLKGEV